MHASSTRICRGISYRELAPPFAVEEAGGGDELVVLAAALSNVVFGTVLESVLEVLDAELNDAVEVVDGAAIAAFAGTTPTDIELVFDSFVEVDEGTALDVVLCGSSCNIEVDVGAGVGAVLDDVLCCDIVEVVGTATGVSAGFCCC